MMINSKTTNNSNKMKEALLVLLFVFINFGAFAQVSIWEDDFSVSANDGKGYDGSNKDISGVDGWDVTYASNTDYWYVDQANDQFIGRDLDGDVTWIKTLDISCYTDVSVSLTIGETGTMESSDYITAEYSTDGSNWTGSTVADDFGSQNISVNSISANTLYLRITAKNNANSEYHWFKDVLVQGVAKSLSYGAASASNVSSCAVDFSAAINNASCQTGITEYGIVYGTSSNPTTGNNKVNLGSAAGNINETITGLSANTTYYARAYVIKSSTVTYGNQTSFATTSISYTAGTSTVSNITGASASVVSSNSSSPCYSITEKGVVYGTSASPTTSNNKVTDNATGTSISVSLTGLANGTTYYVRSYIIVNSNTVYGTESNFTTTVPPIWTDNFANESNKGQTARNSSDLSGVDWSIGGTLNSVDWWKVNSNGQFEGKELDNEVTWTSPSIDIACYSNVAISIFFAQTVNNDNADYIKAEFSTDNGNTWTEFYNRSNDVPSGGETATRTGINGANLLIKVSSFNDRDNEYYYFEQIEVTGTPKSASIDAPTVSAFTKSTATVNANFYACGATVSDKGFVYATTNNPTTADYKMSFGAGAGNIDTTISGLQAGTTYYVKAFATLSGITIYSASATSFTTSTGSAKTAIWVDDFANEGGKGYDGSTNNVSGVDWSISYGSADYFEINSSALRGANLVDAAVWTSPSINISCYANIDVSVDVRESGRLEASDYIKCEYKIDTNSWTVFETNGNLSDDFTSATASNAGLSGAQIQLRITMKNNSSSEIAYAENIEVRGELKSNYINTPRISDVNKNGFTANVGFFYCGTITEKGLVYSTNTLPTISGSKITANTNIEGYSVEVTSLAANTHYYVRAYYTANGTTVYSDEIDFDTAPDFFPIMISEYGTSKNSGATQDRYIELYNLSETSINLNNYALVTYFDGANDISGTKKAMALPNTTLAAGEAYVIVYDFANATSATKNKADLLTTNAAMSFDGNDALVLVCKNKNGGLTIDANGEPTDLSLVIAIDIFGKVGQNSNWSNNGKSSSSGTLVRNIANITRQDKNPNSVDFATWAASTGGFTLDSLGFHNLHLSRTQMATMGNLCVNRYEAKGSNAADSIVLNGNIIVSSKLVLKMGDVELGKYNMKANSSALVKGNKSSYVKINGDGRLQTKVEANNTNVINPIGRNPYLPVVLNCSNCQDVEFDFGVAQDVYQDPTNPVSAITSKVVGETWTIIPSSTITGNITLTFQWTKNRELTSFDRTLSTVSYWQQGTSSIWNTPSSASAAASGTEANSYTQTITLSGMTGGDVYYFGIGSNGSALPVDFGEFTATWVNQTAHLKWETHLEINNDYFEVQRSLDGQWFETIGQVAGNGSSVKHHQYDFVDTNPTGGLQESETIYYRIKQIDYDGNFDYSETRTLGAAHETLHAFTLWPNPNSGSELYLSAIGNYQIFNTQGVMLEQHLHVQKIDITNLITGTYIVRDEMGSHQILIKK